MEEYGILIDDFDKTATIVKNGLILQKYENQEKAEELLKYLKVEYKILPTFYDYINGLMDE